jgi:hypothetical protein
MRAKKHPLDWWEVHVTYNGLNPYKNEHIEEAAERSSRLLKE